MDKLIVVMNKCDLFPQETRYQQIEQQTKKLQTRFGFTRFGAQIPIIPVSAAPKIEGSELSPTGLDELLDTILRNLEIPKRKIEKDKFMFSIDHCF